MIESLAPLALDHLARPHDPGPLAALVTFVRGIEPVALPLDAAWAALGSDAWRGLDLAVDPQGRFDLSLFVVAPGASIPIHDHPGMTVLTRAVSGSLRLECWDAPDATSHRELTLSPDDPPHLTLPDRDNLHRITPVGPSGSAFMDLFLPPYGAGRRCSYYVAEAAGGAGLERLRRLG